MSLSHFHALWAACALASIAAIAPGTASLPSAPRHYGAVLQDMVWVDPAAPPGGDGSQAAPFDQLDLALAAAHPGATVILRDGVYSGPHNIGLTIGSKSLVLRSENGPANCILDCALATYGLVITPQPSARLEVVGLTIEHHRTAIRIDPGSVTLRRCVMRAGYGLPSIDIDSTNAPDAIVRLDGCEFRNISTDGNGGAIDAIGDGTLEIVRSHFEAVQCEGQGAVCGRESMTLRLSHSTFLGCGAGVHGGAVMWRGSAWISNCLFVENYAVNGGAIAAMSKKKSDAPTTFVIDGCTFVDNYADSYGGAIVAQNSQHFELHNSVLWGNIGYIDGPALALLAPAMVPFAATFEVASNDVELGQSSVWVAPPNTLTWLGGNIDVEPRFLDVDGPDNDPSTLGDNLYLLRPTSPCLDAGDNTLLASDVTDIDDDGDRLELVPLDRLFKRRRQDSPLPDTGVGTPPIVDLGCYERQH